MFFIALSYPSSLLSGRLFCTVSQQYQIKPRQNKLLFSFSISSLSDVSHFVQSSYSIVFFYILHKSFGYPNCLKEGIQLDMERGEFCTSVVILQHQSFQGKSMALGLTLPKTSRFLAAQKKEKTTSNKIISVKNYSKFPQQQTCFLSWYRYSQIQHRQVLMTSNFKTLPFFITCYQLERICWDFLIY